MHLGGFSLTKQRIWELDALRGLCIIGMVVFHLIYDMTVLYRLVDWQLPPFLDFIQLAGGGIFLVLSGLCVTLGSRSVRRGLIVFGSGMLCTLVTWGMFRFGLSGGSMIIRFGVLHCLGVCMLLWPLVKKLPTWALGLLGVVIVAVGLYIDGSGFRTDLRFLYPLGIVYPGFSSGDFYPLLPCLGWFLLGAVLGRTVYRKKQTLLPKVNAQTPIFRFLCFCGRQSLMIYLLHQPLLSGALTLITLLK